MKIEIRPDNDNADTESYCVNLGHALLAGVCGALFMYITLTGLIALVRMAAGI